MSTLITDRLSGRKDAGYVIKVDNNTTVYASGQTIQTAWRKMDNIVTLVAPQNGEVVIPEMSIDFTPKRANSRMLIDWWIFHEGHEQVVFRARRNNVVIGRGATTDRWSAMGVTPFDNNNSSTPHSDHFMWVDQPGAIATYTYDLAVGSSTTTNYTIQFNRSVASYSPDYESGYSFMMIQEIAQ